MKEINELNNLLSKYVDQGFFPGVQWQINIEDDVYAGKYGLNNIDTKQEVFDNSIYRIWSMTKPIVAIAAPTTTIWWPSILVLGNLRGIS